MKAKPISTVLLDARLNNKGDIEKVSDIITLYSTTFTEYEFPKYFTEQSSGYIDYNATDEEERTIEMFLSDVRYNVEWNEDYRKLFSFKYGNYE